MLIYLYWYIRRGNCQLDEITRVSRSKMTMRMYFYKCDVHFPNLIPMWPCMIYDLKLREQNLDV